MKKAVIFDLDGTLVNSIYDLADGVNYALGKNGYSTHPEEAYLIFVGNGIKKLIERALGDKATEETVTKVRADFEVYYRDHCCDRTRAYEGIIELLDTFKKNDVKLAVCSNKAQRFTEYIVNTIFGENTFDFIYGQRPELQMKPAPDCIFFVAENLGVPIDECIYIGDSNVDIMAGNNAGVDTLGVTWGFRTEQELRETGAKHIAHKTHQIQEFFERGTL